jgi:predicted Zn finger-like uncharacterized protein
MLVRCPSCRTTYKVSDELLSGTSPLFRCSRCKHTFEVDAAEPRETRSKPLGSEPAVRHEQKEQELTFAFPAEQKDASETTAPDQAFTDLKNPPLEGESKPSADGEKMETWSMGSSEAKTKIAEPSGPAREKESASPRIASPIAQREQPTAPQDTTDKVLSLDPYRDQPASIVPYLTLFMLLVIFFGLLTAFQRVDPAASERIVKKIPLLGTSVLKNNHLKSGVDLQSLRAGYQTIQGNREVFVITGLALNLNPVVVREVRVAGRLYNQDGVEIEHQTIWIGNAISPKIIRGMTIQDISDLQRLKPLKSFDIPPGETVPFTIVFLKAPKGVKDFGCEVLSAEAEV